MKSNQLHFLITAGGTREYIDPVRFITNAGSGKMGEALASSALKAGHKVTFITTVGSSKLKTVKVETAEQMFKAVKRHFPGCDCLIMTAAVADYTPVKKSKVKIKKTGKNLVIKLKSTADILKWAAKNKRKNQFVVGFALEDRNLRKNAEKKLKDKNLDMIIANTPSAIGAEKSTVHIKSPASSWLVLPEMRKTVAADRIIKLIESFLLL